MGCLDQHAYARTARALRTHERGARMQKYSPTQDKLLKGPTGCLRKYYSKQTLFCVLRQTGFSVFTSLLVLLPVFTGLHAPPTYVQSRVSLAFSAFWLIPLFFFFLLLCLLLPNGIRQLKPGAPPRVTLGSTVVGLRNGRAGRR